MKTKIGKGIVIVLILLIIIVLSVCHFSYPIKWNEDTLPENIAYYYIQSHNDQQVPSIVLFNGVEIGRKAYYLIEVGEDLGSVTLERGWNGRYKFTHLGYGDGNFLDGIIEDNGRKYFLFGGRDMTAQISRIEVYIDGQSYDLPVPNEADHFLLCTEISSWAEDNHVDRDRLTFYNKEGEDITELYSLSGGGIQ